MSSAMTGMFMMTRLQRKQWVDDLTEWTEMTLAELVRSYMGSQRGCVGCRCPPLISPLHFPDTTPLTRQTTKLHHAYRFICAYLCVFCVFLFHTVYVLYYCEYGRVDLMGLKPNR